MTKCEQCGAAIDPTFFACPYCHLTTPAGVAARARDEAASRAQQQWQQAVQYQNQQAVLGQVRTMANQSLVISIVGVVMCCLPVGVFGIVQGWRSRSLATAQKIEVPRNARLGMILGIASCVLSVALLTYIEIDSANAAKTASARIAEIDKQIGSKKSDPKLEQSTACGLAEQYALKSGHEGTLGYTFKSFECIGKLTQTGDVADLQDFKMHGTDSYTVAVCFKKGTIWYVGDMREDGCAAKDADEEDDSGSPAGSATGSAAPTRRNLPPHHDPSPAAHDAGSAAPHASHSAGR